MREVIRLAREKQEADDPEGFRAKELQRSNSAFSSALDSAASQTILGSGRGANPDALQRSDI